MGQQSGFAPLLSTSLVIVVSLALACHSFGLVRPPAFDGATFFVVFVIGVLFSAGAFVYTVPGGRWALIAAAFLLGAIAYQRRTASPPVPCHLRRRRIVGRAGGRLAETLGSGPLTVTVGSTLVSPMAETPMWSSWWPMPTDPMKSSRNSTVSTSPALGRPPGPRGDQRHDVQPLPLTAFSVSSALNLDPGGSGASHAGSACVVRRGWGNNTMSKSSDTGYRPRPTSSRAPFGRPDVGRGRSSVGQAIGRIETSTTWPEAPCRSGPAGLEDAWSVSSARPFTPSDGLTMRVPSSSPTVSTESHLRSSADTIPVLLLDSSCEPRPDMALGSFTSWIPGLPEQQEQEAAAMDMSRRSMYRPGAHLDGRVGGGERLGHRHVRRPRARRHGPAPSIRDQWTDEQLREDLA